tara:strand:- start:168 stop:2120 length:1953 start_codon:yes stop_codon:yes gene_type:complete
MSVAKLCFVFFFFFFFFFVLEASSSSSFPDSDDPISAAPLPLVDDDDAFFDASSSSFVLRHSARLITRARLTSYGQLHRERFRHPPPGPAESYDKVVLEWEGSVKGVQFDRMGALWFDEVPIVRMTTPEPNAKGVRWRFERDVTEYRRLFFVSNKKEEEEAHFATLSIPNVIDKTYTGVLCINATLKFYERLPKRWENETSESEEENAFFPEVQALFKPIASGNPWKTIALSGNETHKLRLKQTSQNIRRAFVDVYASGHSCEEFWYTNLPNSEAAAYGMCDGGAFRMFEIRIDGKLAGARFPFPVVYTGGLNPLLWRPITGIESFDVVPYRFDISPFTGLLNDGKEHTLEIKVKGNSKEGMWYVDPVMILYKDEKYKVLPGKDIKISVLSPLDVQTKIQNNTTSIKKRYSNMTGVMVNTEASLSFVISGSVGPYRSLVSYNLHSTSANEIIDSGSSANQLSSTAGLMVENIKIKIGDARVSSPLFKRHSTLISNYIIEQDSKEDNSTFDLNAQILPITRSRAEKFEWFNPQWPQTGSWLPRLSDKLECAWSDSIFGSARYNRSLSNHSLSNIMKAETTENFVISLSPSSTFPSSTCYEKKLKATNGTLHKPENVASISRCVFPLGVSFCGQELCGPGVDGIRNARGGGE